MNNKVVHYLFAAITAISGIVQYATPFIPTEALPAVLTGVGAINTVLHLIFPTGDPVTPASK